MVFLISFITEDKLFVHSGYFKNNFYTIKATVLYVSFNFSGASESSPCNFFVSDDCAIYRITSNIQFAIHS